MIPAPLKDAFESQARGCVKLGSPFMGRLNTLFATQPWPAGAIRDRAFGWEGDVSAMGASVPLRLAGALHALRLRGDRDMARVYPPNTAADEDLWAVISAKLVDEAGFIDAFIDSPPQTNEVRRACVLIAVGHWLTEQYGLPLHLLELGASAGLNLMWDQFALQIGDTVLGPVDPALLLKPQWAGPLPPSGRPVVTDRRGVDLNPLDPQADALRLRSYLWPDQPERLTLTDAAIACHGAKVDQGDAVTWLQGQLAPRPDHVRLIYHTIAWQYFPAERQEAGTALIEAAGAEATDTSPLAWFGMEADEVPDGAGLHLRLWPGDLRFDFGRVDFHGRWVKWMPPLGEARRSRKTG